MNNKDRLKDKLIGFQSEIVALGAALQEERKRTADREETLFLELFAVLDACENIFNNMADKEPTLDKTAQRMLKSFRAVHRKLIRLLEEQGVEQIVFPDGKSVVGLCKVVKTQPAPDREEGQIIAVIRNGYRLREEVLRPAEVITVANP